MTKTEIIVFDFDGTLSWPDSNIAFGKYCFRHSIRPWLFLPVIFVAFIAKLFNPNGIWWRQKIRSFLTPQLIKKLKPGFIKLHKQNRFGWARQQVANEKSVQRRKVILITAGMDYMVPELVDDMKFDAILTSKMNPERPWEFEFFCYGANKVLAMDEWAKKNKIIPQVIKSYSDHKSDMPLMELAKERIWIDAATGTRRQISN